MDRLVSSLKALSERDVNLSDVATVFEKYAHPKG